MSVGEYVTASCVGALLEFPAISSAAAIGIFIVTEPAVVGVTVTLYIVELSAVNADVVPLDTTKSVISAHVTGSENVARTLNDHVTVESGVERTTEGDTISYMIESCVAALLSFPDGSTAACVGISIVTVPFAVGVTSTLYPVELIATNPVDVPLLITKSEIVTPVTGSVKVAVTVNGQLVGLATLDVSVGTGATISIDSAVAVNDVPGVFAVHVTLVALSTHVATRVALITVRMAATDCATVSVTVTP